MDGSIVWIEEPPMSGVGGTKTFTLTGKKAGSSKFRIAYARPWEWDGTFDDRNDAFAIWFTVTVV